MVSSHSRHSRGTVSTRRKAGPMAHERHSMIRPADALAIAIIVLIIVLLNWAALTGATHYLQPMDTAESLYVTDFRFLAQAVRKGEWGLWDPHTFGGFPVFASPHSAFFYPINRF